MALIFPRGLKRLASVGAIFSSSQRVSCTPRYGSASDIWIMGFQTASSTESFCSSSTTNTRSSDLRVIVIVVQLLPQVHGHGAGRQRGRASPPAITLNYMIALPTKTLMSQAPVQSAHGLTTLLWSLSSFMPKVGP
jgi:hypothetical protein